MHYEIQHSGGRQELNATFEPDPLTVGGDARARLVRGYGSSDWYRVEDSLREASVVTVRGLVWSDGSDSDVATELSNLKTAMASATRLYAVETGSDVSYLEVDGGLEPVEEPESSQLVEVTLMFYPEEDEWRDASSDELVPF